MDLLKSGAKNCCVNFPQSAVVKTGKNAYKFEKTEVSKSEIFTYKAFPERIVDEAEAAAKQLEACQTCEARGRCACFNRSWF